MPTSKLLSREEVAAAIQVSLVKLDRMRLDGTAPPEIKIGRSVRFPEAAFESWLSQQSNPQKPTTLMMPSRILVVAKKNRIGSFTSQQKTSKGKTAKSRFGTAR